MTESNVLRKALDRAEAYATEYEFDSDEGCHTPNDLERMLLLDMINGLFDDEEFVSALALRTPSDGEDKASFLATLAGLDDAAHFVALAASRTWENLAKTALSALVATRAEVDEFYARPQGMEAIRLAMEVLNLTILSGTQITEGHDGNHSTYTPLAERAKVAWSALSALTHGKE